MSNRMRYATLALLVVFSVFLSWTSTITTIGNGVVGTSSAMRSLTPLTIKEKNGTEETQKNWFRIRSNTQPKTKSITPIQQTQSNTSIDDAVKPMTNKGQHDKGSAHTQHSSNQSISILVQLSGELGNNLGKFAHGICLQEWLQDEFQTASTIVVRHQLHPKWIHGYRNAVKCFPYTRQFDFAAGNTPSIDAWLTGPKHPHWWETMLRVNREGAEAATIRQALGSLVRQWRLNLTNATSTLPNVTTSRGTPLSNPFLYANQFAHLHVCMDKYYDIIRARLAFNSSECCNQVPLANETVFVSVLKGWQSHFC